MVDLVVKSRDNIEGLLDEAVVGEEETGVLSGWDIVEFVVNRRDPFAWSGKTSGSPPGTGHSN